MYLRVNRTRAWWLAELHDLVPQKPFGFLYAALKIADRVQFAQFYAEADQRLRNPLMTAR